MNLFFVIAGLIVIVGGWLVHLRAHAKGRKAQAWPSAPGRVVSSEVVSVPMGGSSMLTPAVVYAYQVDGRELQSAGFRLGAPPMFNTPAKAKALAEKYPAGSQVTVHYDPTAPANAALELQVGEGFGPLIIYAFGATFFVLGLLGMALRF